MVDIIHQSDFGYAMQGLADFVKPLAEGLEKGIDLREKREAQKERSQQREAMQGMQAYAQHLARGDDPFQPQPGRDWQDPRLDPEIMRLKAMAGDRAGEIDNLLTPIAEQNKREYYSGELQNTLHGAVAAGQMSEDEARIALQSAEQTGDYQGAYDLALQGIGEAEVRQKAHQTLEIEAGAIEMQLRQMGAKAPYAAVAHLGRMKALLSNPQADVNVEALTGEFYELMSTHYREMLKPRADAFGMPQPSRGLPLYYDVVGYPSPAQPGTPPPPPAEEPQAGQPQPQARTRGGQLTGEQQQATGPAGQAATITGMLSALQNQKPDALGVGEFTSDYENSNVSPLGLRSNVPGSYYGPPKRKRKKD